MYSARWTRQSFGEDDIKADYERRKQAEIATIKNYFSSEWIFKERYWRHRNRTWTKDKNS